MRYAEITGYPRPHNPELMPEVIHIDIDPERWDEMQIRIADQTQSKVLGHDEGPDGLLTVHVACASPVVARRLEARWSA